MINLIRKKFHPLWRLRKNSAFRKFQERYDRTVYTRLPETNLRVAIKLLRDASWLTNSQNLEPEIKQIFLAIYKAIHPQVFWDIGGNIGFYSWFTRYHCASAEIVILEADQTNDALLRATIKKNRLDRVRVIHAAASDHVGSLEFLTDNISGATGAIKSVSAVENRSSLHHAYGLKKVVEVKSITLDSLLEETSSPPNLIKIDVEGAEHLVLHGGEKMLRSCSPVIIMETQQSELLEWLLTFHYRVLRIDAGNVLCLPEKYNELQIFSELMSYERGRSLPKL